MKMYLKTPISYYGGKQRMLGEILPRIPEHKLYTEAFSGGAAVFWAKQPSFIEVLNDTNTEVINFYRVLKSNFDELWNLINETMHSRKSYEDAMLIYDNPHLFDPVKRAWATWVATSQSFASTIGGGWAYARKDNKCEVKIANARERFQIEYSERLKHVQIECRDALLVIKSRDNEDAFHYIDPPYLDCSQGHYGGYRPEDFEKLLKLLTTIKGKFLLSSYPGELLEKYTAENGWKTLKFTKAISASKERGKTKTEVLTANYEI